MSKREHLQFLVLMVPTFLVLVAAAVSMANLSTPPAPELERYSVAEELFL